MSNANTELRQLRDLVAEVVRTEVSTKLDALLATIRAETPEDRQERLKREYRGHDFVELYDTVAACLSVLDERDQQTGDAEGVGHLEGRDAEIRRGEGGWSVTFYAGGE